jgi:hypothetical protein
MTIVSLCGYCAGAPLISFLLLLFALFKLYFSPFMGEWLFFAYPKKSHQKKGYPTCSSCGCPAMLE